MVTLPPAERADHKERRECETQRGQGLHTNHAKDRKEGQVERQTVGRDQDCPLTTKVEPHQPVEHHDGREKEPRTVPQIKLRVRAIGQGIDAIRQVPGVYEVSDLVPWILLEDERNQRVSAEDRQEVDRERRRGTGPRKEGAGARESHVQPSVSRQRTSVRSTRRPSVAVSFCLSSFEP